MSRSLSPCEGSVSAALNGLRLRLCTAIERAAARLFASYLSAVTCRLRVESGEKVRCIVHLSFVRPFIDIERGCILFAMCACNKGAQNISEEWTSIALTKWATAPCVRRKWFFITFCPFSLSPALLIVFAAHSAHALSRYGQNAYSTLSAALLSSPLCCHERRMHGHTMHPDYPGSIPGKGNSYQISFAGCKTRPSII